MASPKPQPAENVGSIELVTTIAFVIAAVGTLVNRVTWNDEQYSVGVSVSGASIGGKPFIADADTPGQWIAAADNACYAAKGVGRGQIRFGGVD